jgi:hypothetical protein
MRGGGVDSDPGLGGGTCQASGDALDQLVHEGDWQDDGQTVRKSWMWPRGREAERRVGRGLFEAPFATGRKGGDSGGQAARKPGKPAV